MQPWHRAALAAAWISLCSCAAETSAEFSQNNDAVMYAQHGVIDPAYHVAPAVGAIFSWSPDRYFEKTATATLIRIPDDDGSFSDECSNIVLTAAHVFDYEEQSYPTTEGLRYFVRFDVPTVDGSRKHAYLPVLENKKIRISPNNGTTDLLSAGRWDFTVAKLAYTLCPEQLDGQPIPHIAEGYPEADSGKLAFFVGYGDSLCNGGLPWNYSGSGLGSKRAGVFDWPNEGLPNASQLLVLSNILTTCKGDSGGPVLVSTEAQNGMVTLPSNRLRYALDEILAIDSRGIVHADGNDPPSGLQAFANVVGHRKSIEALGRELRAGQDTTQLPAFEELPSCSYLTFSSTRSEVYSAFTTQEVCDELRMQVWLPYCSQRHGSPAHCSLYCTWYAGAKECVPGTEGSCWPWDTTPEQIEELECFPP
ncbi:MAG: hypothetical protein IPJ88_05930 [Myxococcales bacterium]|nr:MAG: hypothetical protein IPJ88_05930 [Myxococcales bacterium]